ncbi:2-keto-4-pentenoate hydratase [Evansella sp. LMS18]|uniref:2-keto-4-pentenoate hydratase n=1 Tax=Evansella sp. LMS18 TaxID=2924033 RepID=UPI0020D1F25F|nr:2-keto-4-pentenoate hydratase [Evansella sp. LMS18]UTR10745.1 2-keto-4-pentenoate hydratase [Evansella sp. LMS18]
MGKETEVQTYIDKLLEAEKNITPVPFLSNTVTLSEDEAYRFQHELIAKKSAQLNDEVKGYKVSMTSPETQALADTDEPAYGTLLTSNHLEGEVRNIYLSNMNSPLLEAEIAFLLTDDLPYDATVEEIAAKTKAAACLEVPDSRYTDWFPNFQLMDLICDNGVTGKIVTSPEWKESSTVELEKITVSLKRHGKKIDEGISTHVMSNPLNSILWLVKKLAKADKYLKKGMVISSGTLTSPIPLEKGVYEAEFSQLGSVKINVTD